MGDAEWSKRAACAGEPWSLFFPDIYNGSGTYDPARALCGRCPVQGDCLTYAIDNVIDEGFWGGCTPGERERIRKQRRRSHV